MGSCKPWIGWWATSTAARLRSNFAHHAAVLQTIRWDAAFERNRYDFAFYEAIRKAGLTGRNSR